MDIFKFNNPTALTIMESGEIINGLKSKMWVERYMEPGEFKLVAKASSEIHKLLPLDTFISHVGTKEIMMVEDHEIIEEKNKEPEIVVTGRSFDAFMHERVIGTEHLFNPTNDISDIVSTGPGAWYVITSIIQSTLDLPYIEAICNLPTTDAATILFEYGDLHDRAIEIFSAHNLGIKVIRPGYWTTIPPLDGIIETAFEVHAGINRSAEVVFSHSAGDIERAEYFKSIRNLKNAALVAGKWVGYTITGPELDYKRRWLYVDSSSLDSQLSAAPVDPELTEIATGMDQRGRDAMDARREIGLMKAEISKNVAGSRYRHDFDIGDLVTVHGNYDTSAIMRVTEYVEIEDREGYFGYPILSKI